jgi:hypothetical protein
MTFPGSEMDFRSCGWIELKFPENAYLIFAKAKLSEFNGSSQIIVIRILWFLQNFGEN